VSDAGSPELAVPAAGATMGSGNQSSRSEGEDERARARATVDRFEQRLSGALASEAPSKLWVRSALRRQGAKRCPVRFRRLSLDVILRYGDQLADLFVRYPDDVAFLQAYDFAIGYVSPTSPTLIDPVTAFTEDASWIDEWGTTWSHAKGGVGASPTGYPLRDWADLDEYLRIGLPDPDSPGRLDGASNGLERHGADRYTAGQTHLTLWERFHCLRGMEEAFADLYLYPRETERLLDALTEWYVHVIRRWGLLANVDAMWMGDDWGSQGSLMISPEMWRQSFAPRYRRFCDEAHRLALDVHFHSDGNIFDIIGDLIDAGVDVIDPVQPSAIDVARVAREFGGAVAFSGGIDDNLLATGTPDQVRAQVTRAIDVLGAPFGNAYLLAPSNSITPDVPFENLVAMFEAAHQA